MPNVSFQILKGNLALHSVFKVRIGPRRNISCENLIFYAYDSTSSHSSSQQEDKLTAEETENYALEEKTVYEQY